VRREAWLAAAGLLMMLLSPGDAAAQRRGDTGLLKGPVEMGLRAGRDFENHAWSLGGQIGLPIRRSLELRPSGDLFFPRDDGMGWQLNGDAAIRLGQDGSLYAGGGVAFVHPDDSDTETGYNLFFGLSLARSSQEMKGFAEFRWTFVEDDSPFRLALGFMYRL
jgi:hypothetical protein